MEQQLIITISREYGSGGHDIGRELAERLGISFYDRNLLDEIANEKEINVNHLKKYDERPKRLIIHRTVRGMSNSPEENIANIQFDYLREKAKNGESFVIVGRCAEEVLKECHGLIKIFVLADEEMKAQRICEKRGVTYSVAQSIMKRHDRKRKAYHNSHCEMKWGDARGYDMTINSSKLGAEKTLALLEDYVAMRKEQMSE